MYGVPLSNLHHIYTPKTGLQPNALTHTRECMCVYKKMRDTEKKTEAVGWRRRVFCEGTCGRYGWRWERG